MFTTDQAQPIYLVRLVDCYFAWLIVYRHAVGIVGDPAMGV